MAESVQQHTRAYGVDTVIRKARGKEPAAVARSISEDDLARLYDVTKPHPYEDVLDEDERRGY